MTYQRIPSIPGHILSGNLPEFKANPLNKLLETGRTFGKILKLRIGPRNIFFLNHPSLIKHVLVDNYRNYDKKTRGWNKLRPLFGEGLLTSSGPAWIQQRRVMQPAFVSRQILFFFNVMVAEAEVMARRWSTIADTNQPINIASEMMEFTFRVVAKSLFSQDVDKEIEIVGEGLSTILSRASESYSKIVDFPLWVPILNNRRAKNALKQLDQIVYAIISKRRKDEEKREDLLFRLMEARDPETGKGMTNQEVRDQVMTLFMTGHETTAVSLSWAWYLLSKNPDIERKMDREIKTVLNGNLLSPEKIEQLTYTSAVFKEVLRLYPPVWVFSRRAIEDDIIEGYKIRSGSTVFICPYVSHRDLNYFKNPEGFDPERFLSRAIEDLPQCTYFPFGSGPRICIGREFAMMEALTFLSTMAQKFRLCLLPGHPVEADASITLRPKNGVQMTIEKK